MKRASPFLSLLVICGCGSAHPGEVARPVRLGAISAAAELVFHQDGFVYVMEADGQNVTQITFENPRNYEHVAVSHDRTLLVANEQLPNPGGDPGGRSRLWLFDLEAGTERRLLPDFLTAGNGGVAFGPDGHLYFAAKAQDVFPEPRTVEEHIANAAANDVYRILPDGTGLQRLTESTNRGEADVSLSEDGTLVSYMTVVIDPPNDYTEVRVIRSDGSAPRLVYTGGAPGLSSVHDPEVSPDNTQVVFSQVNPDVPPNFPELPAANTAHDLYRVAIDGSDTTRLTSPGPISIVPHWQGNRIVYLELNDADDYLGISLIDPVTPDQAGTRIRAGGQMPRWIP